MLDRRLLDYFFELKDFLLGMNLFSKIKEFIFLGDGFFFWIFHLGNLFFLEMDSSSGYFNFKFILYFLFSKILSLYFFSIFLYFILWERDFWEDERNF